LIAGYKIRNVKKMASFVPIWLIGAFAIQGAAVADTGQSNIPVAQAQRVETLRPVFPSSVGQLSISPDGRWLLVHVSHAGSTRKLAVYSIKDHEVVTEMVPEVSSHFDESDWTLDSKFFILSHQTPESLDFSTGKPVLNRTFSVDMWKVPLRAGGDPEHWRERNGKISHFRPHESGSGHDFDYAWSPDGGTYYEIRREGMLYCLTARTIAGTERVACHDLGVIRDRIKREISARANHPEMIRLLTSEAAMEEGKKMLGMEGKNMTSGEIRLAMQEMDFQQMAPKEMNAGYFALSPNGQYLYFELRPSKGPGFFAMRPEYSIHAVVDVLSRPIKQWLITGEVAYQPRWHPDNRSLFMVMNDQSKQPDPEYPPMRQPLSFRVYVAAFP
jgi:hypothetical protein